MTVVVTGQGKLLDLRIDDQSLHGTHVQKLGLSIVEAVRAACAAANASALPQLNALFGKQPPPVIPAVPAGTQAGCGTHPARGRPGGR